MTKDWQEANEQMKSKREEKGFRPNKATQQAIQEGDPTADHIFQDRQGREIAVRTYPVANDQYYIRAYDTEIQKPPENATFGQAGQANLRIEQNEFGRKARLQDIMTTPSYEGNGIGGQMLSQVETIARQRQAQEIYGLAPSDSKTLDWYHHRNYRIRINDSGGTEIYKPLR